MKPKARPLHRERTLSSAVVDPKRLVIESTRTASRWGPLQTDLSARSLIEPTSTGMPIFSMPFWFATRIFTA